MKKLFAPAVVLGALVTPATSTAAAPCAKAIQNDWIRQGRVVGHYPLACYQAAIRTLPADLATYGGAAQDIRRAFRAEQRRLAKLHSTSKTHAHKRTTHRKHAS